MTPVLIAELPEMVLSLIVAVPNSELKTPPPPKKAALLPEMVLSLIVSVPALLMPPPNPPAVLSEIVLSRTVNVVPTKLSMAPAAWLSRIVGDGGFFDRQLAVVLDSTAHISRIAGDAAIADRHRARVKNPSSVLIGTSGAIFDRHSLQGKIGPACHVESPIAQARGVDDGLAQTGAFDD